MGRLNQRRAGQTEIVSAMAELRWLVMCSATLLGPVDESALADTEPLKDNDLSYETVPWHSGVDRATRRGRTVGDFEDERLGDKSLMTEQGELRAQCDGSTRQ